MDVEKAKWLFSDFSNRTMNNDFIEATNTILSYVRDLERENTQLKATKNVSNRK